MRKVGALEFFTAAPEGPLWSPTRAWAISTPGSRPEALDKWELRLDQPQPSDGPELPLHDLKWWLLFGDKDNRFLTPGPKRRELTATRRIDRQDAVIRYLGGWLKRLPAERQDARVSVLMPAISDDVARQRYLAVLRRALPANHRVLSEPEMVVEYFRLVKRTLTLDPEKNNVILVLDIGASTSNMTIIQSTRHGTVTEGERGIQRARRLRAIEGISGGAAGRWVDKRLAEKIGIAINASEEDEPLDLTEVERAKVAASLTGHDQPVSGRILTPRIVEEVAGEVVAELKPLLEKATSRLWLQLTGTEAARKLSEPMLKEAGVSSAADAPKLIDTVLLAGGTSRLRGFRDAVRDLLPSSSTKILEVGDSFAVAAAVGALAHILKDKYEPSRLRYSDEAAAAAAEPNLEGGLDSDIVFAWKPTGDGQHEQKIPILERGDPLVYSLGARANVAEVPCDAMSRIKGRLIPDTAIKIQRKGLEPQKLRVRTPKPILGIEVDTGRTLSLRSSGIQGVSAIRLDLNRFIDVTESPSSSVHPPVPRGMIAVDHADEVVVDFGMSKTVIVCPTAGFVDPASLDERQAQQRLDAPSPPLIGSGSAGQRPSTAESLPKVASLPPAVASAPESLAAAKTAHPSQHKGDLPGVEDTTGPARVLEFISSPGQGSSMAAKAGGAQAEPRPLGRTEPAAFCTALQTFLDAADHAGLDVPHGDLMMTLLGLAVRRVVLLAGPPGSGKSVLARMVAHLLGREPGRTFHEVAVQAHWQDDTPLFGQEGLLKQLVNSNGPDLTHFILFDEFNLARPEYYLTRFFHAVEERAMRADQFKLAKSIAVGTLNIDDTSRPPSPKILDRCFLVEVDHVPVDREVRQTPMGAWKDLPHLPGLPAIPAKGAPADDGRAQELLKVLYEAVRENGLREDLLPSRRVRNDITTMLQLHAALGTTGAQLLPAAEVLDRLIASRVLVKIAGPDEQVKPVLEALDAFFKQESASDLDRSRRRIKLANIQARLGFVSPWQ